MITDAASLVREFLGAAAAMGLTYGTFTHEACPSPHEPPKLPTGKCAVYVFSLSGSYGETCPAGAHRALKVGKVGCNSNARFQYQHYNPKAARSTLAGTLVESRILWTYLGITALDHNQVASWIKKNVDRDHFYLEISDEDKLEEVEKYIRGRLGPVFEGG